LKQEFCKSIIIDVILKNMDGTNRMYHANVSDLDLVVPLRYDRAQVSEIVNKV
jgi:UDP-N-acetylglucosamine kinase